MKNCPKCNAPMSDTGMFCPACGARVSDTSSNSFETGGSSFRETEASVFGSTPQPFSQPGGFLQPNTYSQPGGFTQQSFGQPMLSEKDRPMTTGQWLVTMLLMIIPVANIILLLVWAFSSDTNTNKKNWARAELIFMLIGIILSIIFTAIVGAAVAAVFSSL